jgi:hypothetical protein
VPTSSQQLLWADGPDWAGLGVVSTNVIVFTLLILIFSLSFFFWKIYIVVYAVYLYLTKRDVLSFSCE